jgi:hypothetical protein
MVANPRSFSAHPDSEAKNDALKHKFLYDFHNLKLIKYLASVLRMGKKLFLCFKNTFMKLFMVIYEPFFQLSS